MKKIFIEWKRFDKDGKTCARCNDTGLNLKNAVAELQTQLEEKDIDVQLKETKLTEKEMNMSNSLYINGVAIEDVLNGISVLENTCNSCGDLTGSPCCCRAIKINNDVHEEISKEIIKKAILKSISP